MGIPINVNNPPLASTSVSRTGILPAATTNAESSIADVRLVGTTNGQYTYQIIPHNNNTEFYSSKSQHAVNNKGSRTITLRQGETAEFVMRVDGKYIYNQNGGLVTFTIQGGQPANTPPQQVQTNTPSQNGSQQQVQIQQQNAASNQPAPKVIQPTPPPPITAPPISQSTNTVKSPIPQKQPQTVTTPAPAPLQDVTVPIKPPAPAAIPIQLPSSASIAQNKQVPGLLGIRRIPADSLRAKVLTPLRKVANLPCKTIAQLEERMPVNHIYRDRCRVTWAHETCHGLSSRLRGMNGGTGNVNAFYLEDGEYVVFKEPRGVTLQHVAAQLPQPPRHKEDLRGMSYNLYLVQQRRYWNNEPLYVLDDFNAYIHGSQARKELGMRERGESVQQMMEFVAYSVALLNAIPDDRRDPELVNFVQNRIETAVEIFQTSHPSPGASAYVQKLMRSEWFRASTYKHFGSGFVDNLFSGNNS